MRLTLQQQLQVHLWGSANILRGKTTGQDNKNYILWLMLYKRLCDKWEYQSVDVIAELERQQGSSFTDAHKTFLRQWGDQHYSIPIGSRWGDVNAVSTNIGEALTSALSTVASANDELPGVFTVDWD